MASIRSACTGEFAVYRSSVYRGNRGSRDACTGLLLGRWCTGGNPHGVNRLAPLYRGILPVNRALLCHCGPSGLPLRCLLAALPAAQVGLDLVETSLDRRSPRVYRGFWGVSSPRVYRHRFMTCVPGRFITCVPGNGAWNEGLTAT